MRAPSSAPPPGWWRRYGVLLALLSCAVYLTTDVSIALVDNFHEGEFLGFVWHMGRYYAGAARFPLYVHGAMDYAPALLAVKLFGRDFTVVGTRVLLTALSALQGFLFLDLGRALVPSRKDPAPWLLLLGAVFWIVTPPLNSAPVVATYFPVRDLFLSLSLWGFARCVRAGGTPQARAALGFAALGGAASAVALFWCYNRGLAAAAFLAVFCLGLLWRGRFAALAAAGVSSALCLWLLDATRALGTLGENLENISYWLTSSSEINYIRFQFAHVTGLAGLLLLVVFSAVTLGFCLWAQREAELEDGLLPFFAAGLVAVQALAVAAVGKVPIPEYALHAGWPSVLLLVFYGSRLLDVDLAPARLLLAWAGGPGSERTRQRVLALAAAALVAFLFVCQKTQLFAYVRFAKNVVAPTLNDRVLPSDALDVATFLAATDDACFFNWTNDGVVAFLAGKSLCTRFPYVHYAGPKRQPELIAALEAAPPQYVVTGGALWPVTRHDEPTEERLPQVAAYLAFRYEPVREFGRYRVLARLRGR